MSDEYFAAIDPQKIPPFKGLISEEVPGLLVEILDITDSMITLRWHGPEYPRYAERLRHIIICRESDGVLVEFYVSTANQERRFIDYLSSRLEEISGKPVLFEEL